MNILVTGVAGFIGFHLVNKLLDNGHSVLGIDNINDYYDTELKYGRLLQAGVEKERISETQPVQSSTQSNYTFIKIDLSNKEAIESLFANNKIDQVIHLAAQAGVRHSIDNPLQYINSNIIGFAHILESCKAYNVNTVLFASSSSVYGDRESVPFKETDVTDSPISMYAVTKKSNELMAYTYSQLFKIKLIGMRFFTVYGPWGRPDMAPFIFTKNIDEGVSIKLNNNGDMERDFTYIDDIILGICKISNNAEKAPQYSIYNIGCSEPVKIRDFVSVIENHLNKKAKIIASPIPKGDVLKTYSDTSKLQNDFQYNPTINISEGMKRFVAWYKDYYRTK